MKNVYLDNAATTQMDEQVINEIINSIHIINGNPSSTHYYGRKAKNLLESCRKKIAGYIGAKPENIFFTSGGSEADNLAIFNSIKSLNVKRIITSKIEHKAVLTTCKELSITNSIELVFLDVNKYGEIDYNQLEKFLLEDNTKTLVTLMHANNEIGTMIDINRVSQLCKQYNAVFHSDTVQTFAHYDLRFDSIGLNFATCSAHKFYGPKGIGVLYMNIDSTYLPMIYGGSQEKGVRSGTENLMGIVGMTKALEICMENLDYEIKYITELKHYCYSKIINEIPNIILNGSLENSLYTVLNIGIPYTEKNKHITFNLDINGFSVSGGSACSSGSTSTSHVIQEINPKYNDYVNIRISFGKYNTKEEIDRFVEKLSQLVEIKQIV